MTRESKRRFVNQTEAVTGLSIISIDVVCYSKDTWRGVTARLV